MQFQERTWCAVLLKSTSLKWRIIVDQGLEFGALLTHLSIAFDCLLRSLLLAKLSENRFDTNK